MASGRSGALVGYPTTTGGMILTGDSTMTIDGRAVARWGDIASCPACKSVGRITGHAFPIQTIHGAPIAREGDIVLCKCAVRPRILALSPGTWTIADEVDSPLAPLAAGYSTASSAPGGLAFDQRVQLVDQLSGEAIAGIRYRLEWSGGAIEGVTSTSGHTIRIHSNQAETASIHIFSDDEQ